MLKAAAQPRMGQFPQGHQEILAKESEIYDGAFLEDLKGSTTYHSIVSASRMLLNFATAPLLDFVVLYGLLGGVLLFVTPWASSIPTNSRSWTLR
jgi:hypothetical protein